MSSPDVGAEQRVRLVRAREQTQGAEDSACWYERAFSRRPRTVAASHLSLENAR